MAATTTEIFGSMVFNDHVMKERLPSATYKSLHETIRRGAPLDVEVANVVANAMKDWAVEHGATHYTHWFQPMTGVTSGEARQLHLPHRGRPRHHGVLRQGAGAGRAGRLQLPLRRPAGHLRGPRLHRLGPHLLRLYQGRHPVHPHRLLLLFAARRWIKRRRSCAPWRPSDGRPCASLRLFGNTAAHQVITTVGPEQEYFLVDRRRTSARGSALIPAAPCSARGLPRGRSWTITISAASSPVLPPS